MKDDEQLNPTEEEEAAIDLTELPSVKNLSPTKIADQFWCEMQLHLKLHLGIEPSEEMIIGSQIHRLLEEELGPVVEVSVTTLDDSIIAYILQVYTKLQMLLKLGVTRELPVIGKIQDMPCLGIIDQLALEDSTDDQKQMVITDFKTRRSKRAPSYEQKRRNRIQLQVYWHLLNELRNGEFTIEMFKEYFEMPDKLVPSDELLDQLPEEHKNLLTEQEPTELLADAFKIFQDLPYLSEELNAVYLYQEDQTPVFKDRTFFHEESFEVDMDWAVDYWLGKRTPGECPQQWMCKFCQFTDNCSYFLRRYMNKKESEKKEK
jgi:exonuclease V